MQTLGEEKMQMSVYMDRLTPIQRRMVIASARAFDDHNEANRLINSALVFLLPLHEQQLIDSCDSLAVI